MTPGDTKRLVAAQEHYNRHVRSKSAAYAMGWRDSVRCMQPLTEAQLETWAQEAVPLDVVMADYMSGYRAGRSDYHRLMGMA